MSSGLSGIVVTCVVALLLALVGGGWAWYGRRRLRAPFGAEVGNVAEEHGDPRAVDRELRRRNNLNDGLLLRTISVPDRDLYEQSWARLEGEFPQSPVTVLGSAERLVARLLDVRGYPGVDAADQLALLSVEHPGALADYRWAQQVSSRARADPAAVTAQELSRALASCHAVVVELLTEPGRTRTR